MTHNNLLHSKQPIKIGVFMLVIIITFYIFMTHSKNVEAFEVAEKQTKKLTSAVKPAPSKKPAKEGFEVSSNFKNNSYASVNNQSCSESNQMLMFANTPFKPECCPNTYSTSTGCACMTRDQVNLLKNRGNSTYSEY
jgi:hypothetical protein